MIKKLKEAMATKQAKEAAAKDMAVKAAAEIEVAKGVVEQKAKLVKTARARAARRGQNVGDPRARLVTVTCCTALCAVHSTEVAFHKCGSETSSSLSLSLSSRHRQPAMGAAAKRFLLLAVLVAARPG